MVFVILIVYHFGVQCKRVRKKNVTKITVLKRKFLPYRVIFGKLLLPLVKERENVLS